jgi:hypothetical protein
MGIAEFTIGPAKAGPVGSTHPADYVLQSQ